MQILLGKDEKKTHKNHSQSDLMDSYGTTLKTTLRKRIEYVLGISAVNAYTVEIL